MTDRRVYDDPTGLVGLNADPGDTDPLYLDGSYGDIALAVSITGHGSESISGTGAVTLALAIAGSGSETITGTSAVVLGLSLAANGTVSGGEVVATGGPTGAPHAYRHRRIVQINGTASIPLALTVAGTGTVNDDELVLLLAA